MNRPPRHRWTALLAAVLFLLSGAGDAFGAHACPHHTAIAAAAGHAGQPGAEHGAASHGPAAHASHDAAAHVSHGPAAPESHGPAAPADHDGHGACTCGGVCPLSAGPAPLAAPVPRPVPLALLAEAPMAQPDGTALPARLLAHLLPFAQAPPLPA